MRVGYLKVEGFKRVELVEMAPENGVVTIGGKNGNGKSSLLDAIYVALQGRRVAPPQPVRAGVEKCIIQVGIGELLVTRTFTDKGDDKFTDTLKVESADGRRIDKPQTMLDDLLGEIGFDPFAFATQKPDEQADTLLGLVPLPIDLDDMAKADFSDRQNRTDVNRDLKAAQGQLAAVPFETVPKDLPDRNSLIEALGNAANTNSGINAERLRRDAEEQRIAHAAVYLDELADKAKLLRDQADAADAEAKRVKEKTAEDQKAFEALEPLAEFVDTDAVRQQIAEADRLAAVAERQLRRKAIQDRITALEAQSKEYTDALEKREKERREALAGAKMPIAGLGFHIPETGKPRVTMNGVPFEQASTAEKLRASTAIAMAANPRLRVLRISEGSLLDEDAMQMLHEMAKEEDFQIFVEVVGSNGAGLIMENGRIKGDGPAASEGKPEPEATEKPAKGKAKPEQGGLL